MSSRSLLCFAVATFSTGSLAAQDRAQPTLAPGDAAPAFELKDSHGKATTLAEIQKKQPLVALVFIRSADW